MSGYPIQRDIVLRGDSASLVHQKDFLRRLELLFNVHVNVSTIENHQSVSKLQYKDRSEGGELIVPSSERSGWVTVRGKSEEDCLKTQVRTAVCFLYVCTVKKKVLFKSFAYSRTSKSRLS